ncbi:MAG: hypothetical protein WBO04_16495 [Steroidobacteraceae bacterium]
MLGAAVVLAFFALVASILAVSRRMAGHRLASAGHLVLAVTCAGGALLSWSLANDFSNYRLLDERQAVAELYFEQTGSRRFRVTLTRLPHGRIQVFELMGDQWRIDARTLAWRNEAARLGVRPRYRLEQLNARDTTGAAGPARSVAGYDLGEDAGPDVWTKARYRSTWARQADAQTAYGPWQPMANGARFEVRLQGGSVLVEPLNEAAADAPSSR